MTTDLSALEQPRSIYSVIGNICSNTKLLRDTEVHLTEKDFSKEFHKVTFSAINNLAYATSETTKINEIDIDNYLASYPKLYKIWEQHDGLTYVSDSISHANSKTFKSSYERLKKFSLLRAYVENGIDVNDLYDHNSNDLMVREKGMTTIDEFSIQEIMDHFTKKVRTLKDTFEIGQEKRDFKAGDGLDNLLAELNEEPEFGYPFQNGFYNAIFRGMRMYKFMLRSAGTGTGKTRQALADICNTACNEIYDYKKGWISNGPSLPSLFISTELEKKELQTTMLAFVSGIDEEVIKDGKYSEVVLKILLHAIKVLKKAPIYCVYVDDFSISDIEEIIETHVIDHNVQYVAFDYIQMTPKLSRSMATAFGSNLREDQILVQFSASLKGLANKYGLYLTSSTQLNRNSKEDENRDTTSLRGGSATADKVDHGVMTFKVTEKDHAKLKHILEQGFHEKPNYSHWIYKNRSGRSNLIIWTYMNLGNMRETPLFVTDLDYNYINDINQISIDYGSIDYENIDKKEENNKEEIKEEIIF